MSFGAKSLIAASISHLRVNLHRRSNEGQIKLGFHVEGSLFVCFRRRQRAGLCPSPCPRLPRNRAHLGKNGQLEQDLITGGDLPPVPARLLPDPARDPVQGPLFVQSIDFCFCFHNLFSCHNNDDDCVGSQGLGRRGGGVGQPLHSHCEDHFPLPPLYAGIIIMTMIIFPAWPFSTPPA